VHISKQQVNQNVELLLRGYSFQTAVKVCFSSVVHFQPKKDIFHLMTSIFNLQLWPTNLT